MNQDIFKEQKNIIGHLLTQCIPPFNGSDLQTWKFDFFFLQLGTNLGWTPFLMPSITHIVIKLEFLSEIELPEPLNCITCILI